jgi:phosphatidylglycerol:prolipoprotein diacylglycerol transferase
MHPILFEIGRFPVYTYGVLLAAAYLLGLQFALVRARTRNLDPNRVMDLGIWIIISALVGAKLLLWPCGICAGTGCRCGPSPMSSRRASRSGT